MTTLPSTWHAFANAVTRDYALHQLDLPSGLDLRAALVPHIRSRLGSLRLRLDPAQGLEAALHVEAAVRWALYGCPVFQLSHGLVEAFQYTDLHGLDGLPLRFPFPCFVVQLPGPGSAVEVVGVRSTRLFPVRHLGVLVTDGMLTPHAPEPEPGPGLMLWLDADAAGCAVHACVRMPATLRDLESVVAGLVRDASLTPADHVALTRAARIVANLCLFLMGDLEPAATALTQKLRRRVQDTVVNRPRRIVLGRTVKIDGITTRSAHAGVSEHAASPACRFVVRGHWRQQAHGPGRTRRRLTWIKPFWKGPQDAAQAARRVYAVDKPAGEE